MASISIQQTLEDLGLNSKEVSLYLLLLQLGTAASSVLADRVNIPRSTAQFTCQQLVKQGLLTMIKRGNAYLFSPEPPEKLLLLLEKQKQDLIKKGEQVHRIIGELNGMMNPHAVLPKIRFFEGRDGVIEGYKTVLKSLPPNAIVLSYLHALGEVEDQFGLYNEFSKVTKELEHREITNLIISPKSKEALKWKAEDVAPRRLTRLMPATEHLSPVEIMIFENSLFGMTMEKNQIFAYIVENKTITHMHRLSFMALWDRLA